MQRAEEALVRVGDLSGRARGTAFHVDHQGLLLTAHEVVDGLQDLLLTWPGGATRRLGADSVSCLPEYGLALLHTDAVVPPLPLAGGHGTRLVSLHLDGQVLQGGIAGVVTARYAARTRFHLVADAWLLHLEQAPYGLPVQAAGSPVLDAETGAVVAVATVALRGRQHGAVLAVPLRSAAGHRAVADLLARNGATVPAHGRALNLAGALELCAATLGPVGRTAADRIERADGLAAVEPGWACDPDRPVLALVGEPGSGRSTELAALARRRAGAAHRLPTLLLRGAELRAGDASLLDAADRALDSAGRLIHVEGARTEQLCRVAAAACRPPLIVLDGPEEMPPALFDDLDAWCAETARLLRRTGARLLIGCRPEFWEQAGPLFPAEDLYGEGSPQALRLDDPAAAAGRSRPSRHPLTLRLLAELRAAAPHLPLEPEPSRAQLLAARVDLACLRTAERIALRPHERPYEHRYEHRYERSAAVPPPDPAAVRRLAAAVAGRVHEAARRMLGPGGGTLDRAGFDELFPWAGGWAQAVLAEGLLEPAGPGYRFAHEEVSDWLQGGRLDLGAALDALLGDGLPTVLDPGHRPPPAAPGARGAHRRGGPRGLAVPAPVPAPGRCRRRPRARCRTTGSDRCAPPCSDWPGRTAIRARWSPG
ncbi:serine protease family protein [Streptacidiphilus albus]|uniref:trypsin-like peptidase domain-containing protein n=1 Tax=Streptacidiphilus albus TaxID=105425 RepID=UPI000690D556|nr:trypsin-like peptidase domain-containing protein [Streptacidiphilus albus]